MYLGYICSWRFSSYSTFCEKGEEHFNESMSFFYNLYRHLSLSLLSFPPKRMAAELFWRNVEDKE